MDGLFALFERYQSICNQHSDAIPIRSFILERIFLLGSIQRLKVAGGVFAKGTDEVAGERIALIDVSTNLAHPTLFLCRLRFGLDVGLIVVVGHGFNL